jgi:hypothetical protein
MARAPPDVLEAPLFLAGDRMAERKQNKKNEDRRATKERIHKLLTDIESRFESETGKASVADYIRLLQLERELEEEDDEPKEIRVTWVETRKPAISK